MDPTLASFEQLLLQRLVELDQAGFQTREVSSHKTVTGNGDRGALLEQAFVAARSRM